MCRKLAAGHPTFGSIVLTSGARILIAAWFTRPELRAGPALGLVTCPVTDVR